jgi:predicted RNA-binding protein with PIN domain
MNVGTPQKIVVDGYNVIYADDSLRRHALRDMERARREFLERIKAYLEGKKIQITVVFDGRSGMTDTESVVPGKLQVIYSARDQTADDLIISMVSESDSPRACLVATTDNAHNRPAVSRLGCAVIGAKGFLKRISPVGGAGDKEVEDEKPQTETDDIDFWLAEFEGEGGDSDKHK